MNTSGTVYPFTAIVGQEEMKTALVLNVINPHLGGVLIRGEKGTAKSTAVRALAGLLPSRHESAECVFSCEPEDKAGACSNCGEMIAAGTMVTRQGFMKVVNLPVSATEDRVVGALDIEHAIKTGEKKFEPGILAYANRNILYVDEVNLLEDHVVDVLLDAAAMGVNTIEREGISFTHPSRFVLVGTMNPEEGDLRPQLIDRFGIVVDVRGENSIDDRMEVVERRIAFEENPDAFCEKFREEEERLGRRITSAKERLSLVTYSKTLLRLASEIACELEVDGHRADIVMIKTAITYAAFKGRGEVVKEDMYTAAKLALPHRMRRSPFEDGSVDFEKIFSMVDKNITV
jgi:magnesium chelatase subunit I